MDLDWIPLDLLFFDDQRCTINRYRYRRRGKVEALKIYRYRNRYRGKSLFTYRLLTEMRIPLPYISDVVLSIYSELYLA